MLRAGDRARPIDVLRDNVLRVGSDVQNRSSALDIRPKPFLSPRVIGVERKDERLTLLGSIAKALLGRADLGVQNDAGMLGTPLLDEWVLVRSLPEHAL